MLSSYFYVYDSSYDWLIWESIWNILVFDLNICILDGDVGICVDKGGSLEGLIYLILDPM
jgi:hypothetical protein